MEASPALPNIFRRFIYRGVKTPERIDLAARIGLLHVVILVAVVFLVIFGLRELLSGVALLGGIDLAVALLLVVADLLLVREAYFSTACALLIGLFGVFFTYLAISGGASDSGLLWAYTYPVFVTLMSGARRGSLINTAFLLFLLSCLFLGFPFSTNRYSTEILLRFCGSYVTLIILSAFFEHLLVKLTVRLASKHEALETALREQRLGEEALRQSELRLRDITLSSFDTIWEVDRDWKYTYISGRIENVLGYTAEELIGTTPFDYMPMAEVETISVKMAQCVVDRKNITDLERLCNHRNGTRVYLLTNGVPVIGPDGKVCGFRGVDKDITERKQSEKKRTRLEEMLQQSRKMEAIGQLAGGIAHDFNNKLGTILGSADMLRTRLKSEEPTVGRYLESIIDTARKSADLTTKMLAFARQGKFVVQPIDLHEAIRDVVKILSISAGSQIFIATKLNAEKAVVMGDLVQLQNAFLNLAANAREAMPGGGKLIFESKNVVFKSNASRTRELMLTPGEYLCVSISDTGNGIEESIRDKIFEPFFTTKAPGEGAGLGLSSVYGTVKSHNGAIEVQSRLDAGSTFSLYLPVTDAPLPKAESAPLTQSNPTVGSVLLVDDDPSVRELIKDMLEELGYTVASCVDGLDALEYYKGHHAEIDVVVLDMLMPRMGGYECFGKLKRINPAVKVVISTGYSLEGEPTKMLKEGAVAFLQKPYSIDDLDKLLQSINHTPSA